MGRFPGEGKGCPLQCSCLENITGCSPVCGFAKTQTRLTLLLFRAPLVILPTSPCSVFITSCEPVAFSAPFSCFSFTPDCDPPSPFFYTHGLTLSNTLLLKLLSHVRFLGIPWTAASKAPPSMGFSRQEYWSGVPLPSLNTFLLVLKYLCNFKNLIFKEISLHAVGPQITFCLLLLFSYSTLHF